MENPFKKAVESNETTENTDNIQEQDVNNTKTK